MQFDYSRNLAEITIVVRKSLSVAGVIFLLLAISGTTLAASQSAGTAPLQIGTRIVGGSSISIDQAAATVALLSAARVQFDGNLFQAQFCGGTVIASRWILTAAHCVVDASGNTSAPEALLVLTGSADLNNPTNQPIVVTRIIAHPRYRSAGEGTDIALLELEYDAMVEPMAIDTQPLQLNDQAFIAGWGAINDTSDSDVQYFPRQLQGTFVSMVPGSICGDIFPAYNGLTGDATICAAVVGGGQDTCQGDSGGPLYRVDTTDNSLVAITGITSWGIGCGQAQYPGVYTNVASYAQWIQDTQSGTANTTPANDDDNVVRGDDTPVLSDQEQTAASSTSGSRTGAMFSTLLPLLMLLLWRINNILALHKPSAYQTIRSGTQATQPALSTNQQNE